MLEAYSMFLVKQWEEKHKYNTGAVDLLQQGIVWYNQIRRCPGEHFDVEGRTGTRPSNSVWFSEAPLSPPPDLLEGCVLSHASFCDGALQRIFEATTS